MKTYSSLMSMSGLKHLTASSSSNPPTTMTAAARSLSDKKSARSALFSSRATKLDHTDLGSGTMPSSIIVQMGAGPRERIL